MSMGKKCLRIDRKCFFKLLRFFRNKYSIQQRLKEIDIYIYIYKEYKEEGEEEKNRSITLDGVVLFLFI